VAVGKLCEAREQSCRQEWEISRDGDDPFGLCRMESRVDAPDGAETGQAVWHDPDRQVGKTGGIPRDDNNVGGDPLQQLHLSNDDGAAADDETPLVLPAEPPGHAARHNGTGRRRT
jgi:hypothetical protein